LTPPRPKMGGCRAYHVLTLISVVPLGTRRRGGRYGLRFVCCAGTGERPHRFTYVVGHENARVREGGRRRRSSQRPGCNGLDTVQVRQAWCPEPTEHTRTWGRFTKGSLCATSDLMALAGSLHRRAVSNHHAGKRSALKGCAVSRTDGMATSGGRSAGRMTPRRPPPLDPQGRGDKRMVGKRGAAEEGYAVVLQRLSDTAQPGVFASHSPGVAPHTRR
jgi:hypothetical protein